MPRTILLHNPDRRKEMSRFVGVDHVWSYDFFHTRTRDGRGIRLLTILDEYTRECLSIYVKRKFTSDDVLERLSDLFFRRGVPEHIRSDNGSEFTAKILRGWLMNLGVRTAYIEPGRPWENGYMNHLMGSCRMKC